MLMTMVHGFSMALADSVPGVSGGTIAFIMGFYERLLSALHQLFGADRAQRRAALIYLVKFAAGWGAGMGASALVLSSVFEKNIYFLSSLFLGLTAAAIPFIVFRERSCLKGRCQGLLFTALGVALVLLLTAFRTGSAGLETIDFQTSNPLQLGYLTISGALAVCAMLLPGISGSTLLLILGIYVPAIRAVKEILQLHIQYLPGMAALGAGVLVGIVFAARLIRAGLRRFRPQMLYLILGLMLGSLYAIAMGPATLHPPKPPLSPDSFGLFAFLLGAALLAALELPSMCGRRSGPRN